MLRQMWESVLSQTLQVHVIGPNDVVRYDIIPPFLGPNVISDDSTNELWIPQFKQ